LKTGGKKGKSSQKKHDGSYWKGTTPVLDLAVSLEINSV